MLIIIGFVLGAIVGAGLAVKRKGSTPDIIQYAIAVGICGAVLSLFVSVVIGWML